MFVESITQPTDEWECWSEKLRMFAEPPQGLAVSIAWDNGDGSITQLNVWDAPGAIADNYMERVLPIVQAEGEPEHKPRRHGEPLAIYLRP